MLLPERRTTDWLAAPVSEPMTTLVGPPLSPMLKTMSVRRSEVPVVRFRVRAPVPWKRRLSPAVPTAVLPPPMELMPPPLMPRVKSLGSAVPAVFQLNVPPFRVKPVVLP